jgi:hypothetical protein
MRFLMLMIPEVYQGAKGQTLSDDFAPGPDDVAEMMKFNEDLARSGALISLDGLHPTSKGARVAFKNGQLSLTRGPFVGVRDVVGGYWIINASSLDEAIQWARRCPARDGDIIEVRQVFDISEFPEETRKAADSPTVRARVEKLRAGSKE